jgi:two-component sensor histidine kinase/membrane protein implicated in regulation of membrane protease activity
MTGTGRTASVQEPVFWRLRLKPESPAAFAFATACIAVASVIRLAADQVSPDVTPFATYFPAVLFATLVGGFSAGMFAMVLGGICASWFLTRQSLSYATVTTSILVYAATCLVIAWAAEGTRRVVARLKREDDHRKRHIALIGHQNEILADIAVGIELSTVFNKIVRSIERYSDNQMLGSILLLDRDGIHLRHGAAPSLPEPYNLALDGAVIGPAAGSCGTAAFRKQPVIVTDIATDALWEGYRHLALPHGLRACWSTPIMSKDSTVLGTFAIYFRQPRAPTAEQSELISFLNRTAALAIEHEQAKDQQQLLLRELNHRVKNTFSIVQSIASQTVRRRVDKDTYENFEARLISLSSAHHLLTQNDWDSVELHDLIAQTVTQPFVEDAGRIRVAGSSIRLPSRMTLLMSLALHELCTNACKYGALSTDSGVVSIAWTTACDESGVVNLDFSWVESEGPAVRPPQTNGFGGSLIERALAAELRGVTSLDYRPEGVVCTISAPLVASA